MVDLSKVTEVKCDVMATIQWTCNTPNLSVQHIKSPVSIDMNVDISQIYTYKHEWDYETTFTGGIPVKVTGDIFIRFNAHVTEIDSFYVHNTWNFLADDDKLLQNGYPNTKTQVYR